MDEPLKPCRGCGRLVRWVTTEKGKAMPLDPEPTMGGNIIMRDGQAVIAGSWLASVPMFEDATPPRYLSHFATCPEAASFRRKEATR